ncbi:MAG: indole-3-glycerol phosphate synthase TrpC [Armatimonadetes bacterium]|jgi:indole-3-glycerol phosphate synthase|nr:indole-3-glycerol phosphate synthase TrpC [Armatimonadota bacterium]
MILDQILEHKREEVARAKAAVPRAELVARLQDAPPVRDFTAAVGRPGAVNLIAEVKRASPSKGLIRAEFDPAAIAAAYTEGGAAAISVLTDRRFFQGDLAFLAMVKEASPLPVLRKDFLVDPYQVVEARAAGADAILLIAAALSDDALRHLLDLSGELGLHALVEVHNLPELERVLQTAAPVIGINNRDLQTFHTTLATTEALAPRVPAGRVLVSESGIFTRDDVARLARAGARAILVGESLMRAPDLVPAVRELVGIAV